MNKYLLLLLIFQFLSCSTLKRSKSLGIGLGSLLCAPVGFSFGKKLSPNEKSIPFNQNLGLFISTSLCAVGGYFVGKKLYKDNPKNFKPDDIEFKKIKTVPQVELNNNIDDINLGNLSLKESEALNIPFIRSLPKQLKNKIHKQRLIKYKIKPQLIKTKDGKKLFFSGGEAIEHKYIAQ